MSIVETDKETGWYWLTVQLPISPTQVSATHLSVHDSLVALHLIRIASVDVATMCMLLGNAGYEHPNTVYSSSSSSKHSRVYYISSTDQLLTGRKSL